MKEIAHFYWLTHLTFTVDCITDWTIRISSASRTVPTFTFSFNTDLIRNSTFLRGIANWTTNTSVVDWIACWGPRICFARFGSTTHTNSCLTCLTRNFTCNKITCIWNQNGIEFFRETKTINEISISKNPYARIQSLSTYYIVFVYNLEFVLWYQKKYFCSILSFAIIRCLIVGQL